MIVILKSTVEQKEIDKLEKQAWAEKQPKRKFDLVQKAKELKQKLEVI